MRNSVRESLHHIDTPAVLLEESTVKANLHRMQTLADRYQVALRPHVKTHKSAILAKRQLAGGAVGITVAKLSEAEVMASHGISDIFMANEIVGPIKIDRLLKLCKTISMSCAVDSQANARELSDRFESTGQTLEVLIDFNSGMDRCGLCDDDEIVSLAKEIDRLPGLKLKGLMTHPGQLYKASSKDEINILAAASSRLLVATGALLEKNGISCSVLSAGATPGAAAAIAVPGVTEFRAGNYIFNDMTQVNLGQCEIDNCALSVLATVISVPSDRRAVIDAGSKSLALDPAPHFAGGKIGFGHVIGRGRGELVTVVSLSEEHGIIEHDGETFAVGDRLRIIPNHACPVMNLFDRVYLVDGDMVVESISVDARGSVT